MELTEEAHERRGMSKIGEMRMAPLVRPKPGTLPPESEPTLASSSGRGRWSRP